jgi:hypothetical protein
MPETIRDEERAMLAKIPPKPPYDLSGCANARLSANQNAGDGVMGDQSLPPSRGLQLWVESEDDNAETSAHGDALPIWNVGERVPVLGVKDTTFALGDPRIIPVLLDCVGGE